VTKKLQGDALVLRNWKRFGRLMMREVKRLEKVVREQDDHIELLERDLLTASMLIERLLKENDMLREMYRKALRREIETERAMNLWGYRIRWIDTGILIDPITEEMTMPDKHEGLPVKGYQPQSQGAVDTVNEHKLTEERLLRHLDQMMSKGEHVYDGRWLAIAKNHFEQGFMALNRAVFKPGRVKLPEDN